MKFKIVDMEKNKHQLLKNDTHSGYWEEYFFSILIIIYF